MVLLAYSSLGKQPTARARAVAAYPAGEVAGMPADWNRQWRELQQYAAELVAGQHRSPCDARAEHWGAPDLESDRPRGRMVEVRCRGKVRNRFYRLARPGEALPARGVISAELASAGGRP